MRRTLSSAATFMAITIAASGHAQADTRFQTSNVTFGHGEIILAGKLYLPAREGPRPAVIFTHGSGDAGRDNRRYRTEAEYLARFGIASLLFDKRGVGQSSGDWRQATFEDLADDALAALHYLRTRPEIDPAHIGMRGASQSGWILPIAASKSSDVAFLILIAPPGVTPYEQILYDVRTDLEDAGFTGRQIEEGLALTRSGLEYARTQAGWPEHARRLEKARGQKWVDIASGPPVPDHWMWSWIRPMLDFDAVPLLARIETPVLVILGDADRECPTEIAEPRLREVLRPRGNGRYAVKVFAGADHGIRVRARAPDGSEPPLAEGYLETLRDWVISSSR